MQSIFLHHILCWCKAEPPKQLEKSGVIVSTEFSSCWIHPDSVELSAPTHSNYFYSLPLILWDHFRHTKLCVPLTHPSLQPDCGVQNIICGLSSLFPFAQGCSSPDNFIFTIWRNCTWQKCHRFPACIRNCANIYSFFFSSAFFQGLGKNFVS